MSALMCIAGALPMKEDLEETTPVYAALCMLMQRPDTAQRLANYIPAMLQVGAGAA